MLRPGDDTSGVRMCLAPMTARTFDTHGQWQYLHTPWQVPYVCAWGVGVCGLLMVLLMSLHWRALACLAALGGIGCVVGCLVTSVARLVPPQVKICPRCSYYVPIAATRCGQCQYEGRRP
jgi:ribosomal protein L40E